MRKNLLALFAILHSFNAIAQNEKIVVELEKTSVTAERFEKKVSDTTKNVVVIEKEEIKKIGASSFEDLLKTVPSVMVSKGYTNNGVIDIRGQGETVHSSVLVLINGVSINSIDMSGPDLSMIDIENIEKIEVIPSGGVLYGDKAVGGVINIITKTQGSSIKLLTGSYGYQNFGANINEKIGDFLIHTDFSRMLKDGYRKNSNIRKNNLGLGLIYDINDKNKIKFNYTYNDADYSYSGSLNKAQLEEDRTQSAGGGKYFTSQNSYSLVYDFQKNNLKIEDSLNHMNKYLEGWSKTNTSSISNNLKVKYDMNKNSIVTGLDIFKGTSETKSIYGDDKIEKIQLAGFISNTYNFDEKLSLNLGYRHETLNLKYENLIKEKESSENLVSAGINYKYSKTGSVFSSFEQNYRTPATDEYAYGSSELKPQFSNTFEIGVRDYLFATYFTGAIYNTLTENEIFLDPTVGYFGENRNIDGKTDRKGLELSTKTYFGKTTISQAYSLVEAIIEDGKYKGKTIPWVPKNKYSLRADYKFLKGAIGAEYNYIGELYSTSDWENKYNKVNSYSTINLNTSYDYKGINIFGGINNLFDEKYNLYVTKGKNYYPAEDRNYYLGISYEF